MSQVDLQIEERERIAALSPREKEVLVSLADGLSVKEISDRLGVSRSTTSIHLTRIYEKLGVNKAVIAVRKAIRGGLIRP